MELPIQFGGRPFDSAPQFPVPILQMDPQLPGLVDWYCGLRQSATCGRNEGRAMLKVIFKAPISVICCETIHA